MENAESQFPLLQGRRESINFFAPFYINAALQNISRSNISLGRQCDAFDNYIIPFDVHALNVSFDAMQWLLTVFIFSQLKALSISVSNVLRGEESYMLDNSTTRGMWWIILFDADGVGSASTLQKISLDLYGVRFRQSGDPTIIELILCFGKPYSCLKHLKLSLEDLYIDSVRVLPYFLSMKSNTEAMEVLDISEVKVVDIDALKQLIKRLSEAGSRAKLLVNETSVRGRKLQNEKALESVRSYCNEETAAGRMRFVVCWITTGARLSDAPCGPYGEEDATAESNESGLQDSSDEEDGDEDATEELNASGSDKDLSSEEGVTDAELDMEKDWPGEDDATDAEMDSKSDGFGNSDSEEDATGYAAALAF